MKDVAGTLDHGADRTAKDLGRRALRAVLVTLCVIGFVAILRPGSSLPMRMHLLPTITVIEPRLSDYAANAQAVDEQSMSPAELMTRWEPFIVEASQRFSVPASWIRAVMRMESGGRTMLAGRPIQSDAGAMGLMQLMRQTYDEIRTRYGLGSDLHDPRDNIFAGAAYLSELRKKYGYPALFAAYNAGPGRLEQHLFRKRALPRETRNYIAGAVQFVGGTDRRAEAELAQLISVRVSKRAKSRVKARYAANTGGAA